MIPCQKKKEKIFFNCTNKKETYKYLTLSFDPTSKCLSSKNSNLREMGKNKPLKAWKMLCTSFSDSIMFGLTQPI